MQISQTNSLVLLPIQPAPLPYQYRFTVQLKPGIPKDKVVISVGHGFGETWALADQDTLEPLGFSRLLRRLLQYTEQHLLWGQSIQVRANYSVNGVITTSTQSAPQTLQLPLKPILINLPDKIEGLADKGYPASQPPQGLRLFWTQLPSSLTHNAWFVGADNRLAGLTAVAAFDRFSFWISGLGLPIKSSAGIKTGEAFATLIKATRLPQGYGSPQATVAQIVAAATANAWTFDSCIFWNATRLLFYAPNGGTPGFREYTGPGVQFWPLAEFAASQPQNSVYKLGLYPKPIRATGLASVA